jgi:hypothetical protein
MALENSHHTILFRSSVFGLVLAGCVGSTQADLVNRWSFNETGGTTVSDSVGAANGEIKGAGATLGGGRVTLSGGPSATAPYVDLPNGIVSGLTDATIEGWAVVDGAQAWARLFDFGSTAGGELAGPGGGGEGQDYFILSASRGTNINQQRFEFRNLDPAFGGASAGNITGTTQLLDTNLSTTLGTPFHFAIVFDSAADQVREYRDGALVGSGTVTFELGNLNDVNNWLGRSNWTADSNLQGSFDEFRIYDTALSDAQVSASFAAGPGTVIPEPATIGLGVILLSLGSLRIVTKRRRRA